MIINYHSNYVINAPSLKYLKIEGASCFRSCLILRMCLSWWRQILKSHMLSMKFFGITHFSQMPFLEYITLGELIGGIYLHSCSILLLVYNSSSSSVYGISKTCALGKMEPTKECS